MRRWMRSLRPRRKTCIRCWILPLTLSLATGALAGCARERRTPVEVIADAMQATRSAIRDEVDDRQRRAELLGLVDELDGLLQAQSTDLEQLSRRLRDINADPAATRSAFEAEIATCRERRLARRSRAVDVHFAMMQRTRPEEWERIVERELGALEALGRIDEE